MFLRIARTDNDWVIAAAVGEDWEVNASDGARFVAQRRRTDAATPVIVLDRLKPAVSVTPHPTGRVPIFYRVDEGRIELADHPRPLLREPARLNSTAVAEYFVEHRRVSTGPLMLIDGIGRLPPDRTLQWTPSRGVHLEVLAPPQPSLSFEHAREATYAAIIAELRRIDDGRPVACLVSGGIDSSLVAALALETLPGARERLFLLSARGVASADEHRLQDRVAAALRLQHLLPPVRTIVSVAALRALNRDATAPSGGLFTGVYQDIAEAAAALSVGTILGGEGGEELFEPHPYVIADLLHGRHFLSALLATSYFATSQLAGSSARVLYDYGVQPLFGRRQQPRSKTLQGLLGPFADRLGSVGGVPASRRSMATFEALHDIAAVPHYEPAWGGAEPRFVSPLVAPAVVQAALSLRLEERIPRFAAQSKRLLRSLAEGHLPVDVRLAPKVGVTNLLSRMTNGCERELADVVARGSLADIDIQPAPDLADPANVPASESLLWVLLLVLTIWYEEVQQWTVGPPKLSTLWRYGHSSSLPATPT